jgi:TetR/AcrR family transcriptional regulator, fatty acid metabolism regulator protein
MRLPPEDRMAEILATARITLAEKGYESFLPADVAARCGVSEATVYRYFPTKRDLLVKVAEDWFGEILAVEPEIAQQGDIFQQLRLVIRHSLTVVRKEPSLTRFVLMELRADPAYRSTHIYALNRRFTSSVVNLVKDAVARGIFRKETSPSLVRDMIFGCIEHRTWAYQRGQGDFSVEATADSIADIIFRGLAAPSLDHERIENGLARLRVRAKALNDEIEALNEVLDTAAAKTGGAV